MKKLISALPITAGVAVAVVGVSSGCLASRTIGAMEQSGDKNVTLVETTDVYALAYVLPVRSVQQFWQCSEAPGTMSCKKVCDAKGSDLICPSTAGGDAAANSNVK